MEFIRKKVSCTRSSIKYLRLTRGIPICLVSWDTYSAYKTCISNQLDIDPETKLTFHQGFKERIILYKKAIDIFGSEYQPCSITLKYLFSDFIN